MTTEKTNNPSEQIEKDCLNELMEVLKKHNCHLEIEFNKNVVMGTPVLSYHPTIVYKGEVKKE